MSSGEQVLDVPAVAFAAGYKFCPMDSDVVVYYLKRKILGEQLHANIIPTTDVYASSPDKLPLGKLIFLILKKKIAPYMFDSRYIQGFNIMLKAKMVVDWPRLLKWSPPFFMSL